MKALSMIIGVALLCLSMWGCQDYAKWQQTLVETDILEQRAAILKLYRQCLEKYQNDPPQAKAQCEHYTQSLHAIDVRGMK